MARFVSRAAWLRVGLLVAGLLAASCLTRSALAADAAAPPPDNKKAKIPEPEEIDLTTKDGVVLRATFFAGTQGKESIPIIMLHGLGGNRNEFADLAKELQKTKGCAILCPDLRGHGESTKVRGSNKALDQANMPIVQYGLMVTQDMETCKAYLMEQNNEGKCNINKLCLVGAELGGLVAANYTVWDWHWPVLVTGKQGQDVRGLVLLSVPYAAKGLKLQSFLGDGVARGPVSVYLAVGSGDPAAAREAKRINTALQKFHPEPPEPKDRTLVFDQALHTQLQGTQLLTEPALSKDLFFRIGVFIDLRLIKLEEPWKDRSPPLAGK